MPRLQRSLQAWGTPEFKQIIQQEIAQLDHAQLPLQQALSLSSAVTDSPIQAMMLAAHEEAELIRVKAGVFYTGVVAGCSCADDPTPLGEQQEYCVMEFCIDKLTAQTAVALLPE